MTTYLPREVREGLEAAHRLALRRKTRLRVVVGDEVFPILRLRDHGMVVPADGTPRLRGLVDVYDGGRHLWQCLIVASAQEGERCRTSSSARLLQRRCRRWISNCPTPVPPGCCRACDSRFPFSDRSIPG